MELKMGFIPTDVPAKLETLAMLYL